MLQYLVPRKESQ